jgi:hypothetical protein
MKIKYRIESFDAAVDVPFGHVTGTTWIKAQIWECDLGAQPFDAEAWFHPQHRVVKMTMIPGFCEVGLVATWDK